MIEIPIYLRLFAIGAIAAIVALWLIASGPRIVSVLILKYLRRRRIAWVSLIAVMLCTAMVLVVISVMGGWLRMFREQFHGLSGDVIVDAQSLAGFPYYNEMIAEIEKLPNISAAVPRIRTFGLINIANVKTDGVQVIGFPIEKIGGVNKFPQSLYLQFDKHIEEQEEKLGREMSDAELAEFAKTFPTPTFNLLSDRDYKSFLPDAKGDVTKWPGMIAGAGVLEIRKGPDGKITRQDYLYELPAKLTVLGISPSGFSIDLSDKAERNYWIVDDSRTQVWQYDSNTVYVPFDVLQKDLGMDEQEALDKKTKQPVKIPARTSEINIRVKDGVDVNAARADVEKVVLGVLKAKGMELRTMPDVKTWEQTHALWLGAIEKEVVLVTFLFGIISLVAVFLIFCIFYMIVVEKTRDIGIIKSVGATSTGVAGIFLGYGLAIGVVGAALGFAASYAIVRNINYLHTKMGDFMGIQVWDPEVYLFDTIPNRMDPKAVTWILAAAIVASVLGALVPAIVAARKHPVESLRWE